MPEVNKTFALALDMKRATSVQTEFTVVEGDNGNVLAVTLTDDGEAVDLENCRVLAVFAKPDGTTVEQDTDGNGVTVSGNVITIELFSGSFAPDKRGTGQIKCELQVYSGENYATLATSAQFTFKCRRGIMNDDTIQSEENYPILVSLIAQVAELSAHVGDMTKSVYDTDADGKVDAAEDSDKLGGNLPAHYATAAALALEQTALTAVQAMTESHASRHGAGGADAVSPASIGAASLDGGKVAAGQLSSATNEQTASYTLALADAGKLILMNSADANTLTIPTNSAVAFPVGTEIEIAQYGAGVTTIAAAEGVAILSMDSAVALAGQYACATIKQLSADTWLLAGAIA